MTGAGELHRKPVLFQFGGDYAASFSRANQRAQAARERHSRVRRAFTPAIASCPATAALKPSALSSPKSKSSEAAKVLMGELRPKLPEPSSFNPKLEAALEQWKKAAEGQGLLRSGQ